MHAPKTTKKKTKIRQNQTKMKYGTQSSTMNAEKNDTLEIYD